MRSQVLYQAAQGSFDILLRSDCRVDSIPKALQTFCCHSSHCLLTGDLCRQIWPEAWGMIAAAHWMEVAGLTDALNAVKQPDPRDKL